MITLSNFQKQFLVFLAMLVIMALVAFVDIELYKTIMMGIGGWQLGSWCGKISRERWPR